MDSGVGWNDAYESIGSQRLVSRSFSAGPAAEARPARMTDQDFFGGNDAWEKNCPLKKVIAFPLPQ